MKLSKKQKDALGLAIACEAMVGRPVQSRAKVYKELAAEGLVRPEAFKVKGIDVEGWKITDRGRSIYWQN